MSFAAHTVFERSWEHSLELPQIDGIQLLNALIFPSGSRR